MYCPFRHLHDGSFGICYGSSCMAYKQWDNNLTVLEGYNPESGKTETIRLDNKSDIQCCGALMFTNPPTINYNGACV